MTYLVSMYRMKGIFSWIVYIGSYHHCFVISYALNYIHVCAWASNAYYVDVLYLGILVSMLWL